MTTRTGAQLLIDCLAAQGADTIFGVPGESYLAVLDALHGQNALRYITCRQEGGAAMAAEAQGKLTGRPGLCMVTRGPGATNASAGVHVAFQDSTPMILFIGQVDRSMLEREAFQEIDYRRMFGQMAKWVAQIDDAARIPEFVARAYGTAMSGRPGPVVLALPEDMLVDTVTDAAVPGPVPRRHAAPDTDDLARLMALLADAKRPLVLAGGADWTPTASAHLRTFAEANGLPVTAAFRRQDVLDNGHPHYAGHVGIGIDPNLAKRVKASDLVLVLGPRLGEMTTSGFTLFRIPVPDQPLVHVHPDPEELGSIYQPTLAIPASVTATLRRLAEAGRVCTNIEPDWLPAARADFEAFTTTVPEPGAEMMANIVRHVRDRLPDDAIVTNGAGNYAIWLHRYFRYADFGTELAPTSGSMGYGVPAAMSAAATHPDRRVVGFAGDGCFMMTSQELATIAHHGLKPVLVVVNNGMFGTIRMHQERHYPGRQEGTALTNPDFAAFARSFGLRGETVDSLERFQAAFDGALEADRATVIEVRTDPGVITPGVRLG